MFKPKVTTTEKHLSNTQLCKTHNTNPHPHMIDDNRDCQHEEADVKTGHYLLGLMQEWSHVQVLADDTVIFVLLVYFVWYVTQMPKCQ